MLHVEAAFAAAAAGARQAEAAGAAVGEEEGGVPVGPLGQRPLIWCVGNTEHITCVPDTGDGREGAKARPPRL